MMAVAEVNTGAPSTHKQASRKGKKAWRKNVDVADIEAGLEDVREEVRITGLDLSQQKAEDLFAFDTVGSKEIATKHHLRKPLKADQILARRSAVPAIDSRKRSGDVAILGDGMYESALKKRKGNWVTKKEVQRLKHSINTVSHLQGELTRDEDVRAFDLWNTSATGPRTADTKMDYLPEQKAKVAPSTISRAPNAITANGAAVPAVALPRQGGSYNPDFDDWEKALNKAGEAEVEAEKKRLADQEREERRLALIVKAQEDELRAIQSGEESAWEGFETDNSDAEGLRAKRPRRKTPAERNKIKRRQEAERLAKHESRMADRQTQALQLAKALATDQELSASQESILADTVEVHTAADRADDGEVKLRRRRLGTIPIPEQQLEVVLPDELQESLRLLKPEGNLLQDRFRNLLVNGKLEARKPITAPRKRRVKMSEKWAFKDFGVTA